MDSHKVLRSLPVLKSLQTTFNCPKQSILSKRKYYMKLTYTCTIIYNLCPQKNLNAKKEKRKAQIYIKGNNVKSISK